MIVIIDNYDSFTYNLYQLIGEMNSDIKVIRNDKITSEQIIEMKPSHIIISPGPGFPSSAGISLDIAKKAAGKIPVLGVCLGHQSIVQAYGGKIIHAKKLMHGKSSEISLINECDLFKGLDNKIIAGRYHSLIADKKIPECFTVIAETDDGEIMAVKHKKYSIYGIQFHPESVLTPCGKTILKNFLDIN